MKLEDFDYELPEELIAQVPLQNREESRLLILDKENGNIVDDRFYNKTFVLTGTLSLITRGDASKIIEDKGGKVTSSVTKKTDYVVVGDNPGSKYDKAIALGIEIISEDKFMVLIEE